MIISFCCTDTKAEPWLDGLRAAFPDASVEVWAPGAPPADYAVVWAPPQQFLDEQTSLKALFNIGAGVDALLQLRLPPGVKVVRLDDAGMSVQMAEYVCHAVIRHFRELGGYEADMQQGKWSFRRPRSRMDYPVGVLGLGVLGSAARADRVKRYGFTKADQPRALPGAFDSTAMSLKRPPIEKGKQMSSLPSSTTYSRLAASPSRNRYSPAFRG